MRLARAAMNLRQIFVNLCLIAAVSVPAQEKGPDNLKPMNTTNDLAIHLQDGFHGQSTVITVDGHLVYKGTPHTDERLGIARVVYTTNNTSTHPLVIFTVPAATWSNRVDLTKGQAFGFSVLTNGTIQTLQATNFGYD